MFSDTHPHPISAEHGHKERDQHRDQHRNSTDPDVIHYLYFEDNDGFFPPSWIGKDPDQRSSSENTSGNDFDGRDTSASAGKGNT
ncbi:hypothetical protein N7491_001009 [Penicillium cf. griseofulvum]|uniref:Uncharacterized protein n=1 Tax=Penicillium cf. griseofulvum TaxID=2972120 RepID=A0A9W9JAV0_9EURO|nr:hypothetical protein N7472_006144 [Penicillium cf. griseofulvum]KAJ5444927.1 hypothetical protein N7491_001009 [Penicillium cf. griseofulvum]KAJ5446641.1 hypothetical protein N7445_001462 [Penicillium cf. griseofulvum]